MKKLGAYKPGQYWPSKEDLKVGFKEKKIFVKVIINCLILRLSIATQLPSNSSYSLDFGSFSTFYLQKFKPKYCFKKILHKEKVHFLVSFSV